MSQDVFHIKIRGAGQLSEAERFRAEASFAAELERRLGGPQGVLDAVQLSAIEDEMQIDGIDDQVSGASGRYEEAHEAARAAVLAALGLPAVVDFAVYVVPGEPGRGH